MISFDAVVTTRPSRSGSPDPLPPSPNLQSVQAIGTGRTTQEGVGMSGDVRPTLFSFYSLLNLEAKDTHLSSNVTRHPDNPRSSKFSARNGLLSDCRGADLEPRRVGDEPRNTAVDAADAARGRLSPARRLVTTV